MGFGTDIGTDRSRKVISYEKEKKKKEICFTGNAFFAGRCLGGGRALSVSGVESRTSSPVRLLRDASMQGSIPGLYPCGEGAGYAGGIASAAADGIKTAEAIAKRYRPFDSGASGLRNF